MLRLAVLWLGLTLPALLAQEDQPDSYGPLISITSPDTGTTFAFGTIKSHALLWDKKQKMLYAQVTFIQSEEDGELQASEDTHQFRLPGVTFDQAHKLFFATSPKGEQVPIAQMKKKFFLDTVVVLQNAVVRIQHPRGVITVILEAVKPVESAAQVPDQTNDDGTRPVDIHRMFQ